MAATTLRLYSDIANSNREVEIPENILVKNASDTLTFTLSLLLTLTEQKEPRYPCFTCLPTYFSEAGTLLA